MTLGQRSGRERRCPRNNARTASSGDIPVEKSRSYINRLRKWQRTRIRIGSEREHLPAQHPVRPHVTRKRVPPLNQTLNRHPLGRYLHCHQSHHLHTTPCTCLALACPPVVLGRLQRPRQPNVAQLHNIDPTRPNKHVPAVNICQHLECHHITKFTVSVAAFRDAGPKAGARCGRGYSHVIQQADGQVNLQIPATSASLNYMRLLDERSRATVVSAISCGVPSNDYKLTFSVGPP